MPGIIVGVDGSEHSRTALVWAMREAAQHRAALTVISVRPAPVRPATGVFWALPDLAEDTRVDEEKSARAAVQQFVDKTASELGGAVPDITVQVVTGDPAQELVNASHGADLLVVGSRGGGGWAPLLMGSVSTKVAHHAACPVAIIRRTR